MHKACGLIFLIGFFTMILAEEKSEDPGIAHHPVQDFSDTMKTEGAMIDSMITEDMKNNLELLMELDLLMDFELLDQLDLLGEEQTAIFDFGTEEAQHDTSR